MDDVRLYIFQCGVLRSWQHLSTANAGFGERLDMPVPWFVILHPRGVAIVDGGNPPECITDLEHHWPPAVAENAFPAMTEDDLCLAGLARIGVDPSEVTHLVQSHLHLDHTGALAVADRFPNAEVVVWRREYEYAYTADWFAAPLYIRKDFDKPELRWTLIEDDDDGYDVFGDGRVRMWQTPGHCPGHMSITVDLPQSGTMLLAIDAVPTMEHWREEVLPPGIPSLLDNARSTRKLHRLAARTGATVVPGHDANRFPTFRLAPEHYA